MFAKSRFIQKVFRRIFLSFRPAMNGHVYGLDGKQIKNTRISNTAHIDHIENLQLGENVYIGHYNILEASNGLIIEEGCQLTTFITITTHSGHNAIRLYGKHYQRSEKVVYDRGPIHIGAYTFIGPHTTIMPMTRIGKGSVVAAYSYVRGEFPDFAIIAGNPAQVVGDTRSKDNILLSQHPELQAFYDEWAKE